MPHASLNLHGSIHPSIRMPSLCPSNHPSIYSFIHHPSVHPRTYACKYTSPLHARVKMAHMPAPLETWVRTPMACTGCARAALPLPPAAHRGSASVWGLQRAPYIREAEPVYSAALGPLAGMHVAKRTLLTVFACLRTADTEWALLATLLSIIS